MKRKAPCRDCEIRLIGCHAYCEQYKEWKMEQDERNRAREERQRATPDWPRGVVKWIWREMRWSRR